MRHFETAMQRENEIVEECSVPKVLFSEFTFLKLINSVILDDAIKQAMVFFTRTKILTQPYMPVMLC